MDHARIAALRERLRQRFIASEHEELQTLLSEPEEYQSVAEESAPLAEEHEAP